SRRVEIGRTAVDQVNVHPTVVIVIQESAAGAEAFRQITLRRFGVLVHPRYAAGLGRYFLEDGAARPSWRGAQQPSAAADSPQCGGRQKPSTRKSKVQSLSIVDDKLVHQIVLLGNFNPMRSWRSARPRHSLREVSQVPEHLYHNSDGSSSTSPRSGFAPSISRSSFSHSVGRSSTGLGMFPSFISSLTFLSIGFITSVSHLSTLAPRT